MRLIRIIPFLFIFIDACVDRYPLPSGISSPALVVNGMITDQPGPHTIKLSMSVGVGENTVTQPPVTGATVSIIDDLGNELFLTENQPGVYSTHPSFQGVVGRKYFASIRVGEKEYVSTEQELMPAGSIDRVHYKFEYNVVNPGEITANHAFDIFIDARGTEGYPNLFRWRWSSVYEFKTFPELRTNLVGFDIVPDPVPCSGYIVVGGAIQPMDTCSCCRCWAPEASKDASASNNRFVSNDVFKDIFVARLPLEKMRFNIRYYIKVEQLSVSEEVHQFWKLVAAQQDGQGSIFQPNSIRIRGNIRSLTDSDEEVFGVFAVSGVTSKDVFIDQRDVPVRMYPDTITASCLGYFRGATNIKPSFWR